MNRQVENGTLRDKKKEIERKRERKKKRSRVKICDRQKCSSDCGTSYPRKKKKFPSLLFARRSYCSVTLRKKIALKKKKKKEKDRSSSDCRLQIIETGLIKITKIHRVAKCRRQWFFHASPPWELFPLVLAVPGANSRSPGKCVFSAKKNIVKERTTIVRETYVQKGGWAENERQREERDRGKRRVMPLSSDIRGRGAGGRQRRRK